MLHLQITQHYSKPRVTPVEVLPVFPDFKVSCYFIWIFKLLEFVQTKIKKMHNSDRYAEIPTLECLNLCSLLILILLLLFFPIISLLYQMWINPCAQVIFDSDPAPKDISGPAGVEMMSQAMIRCLLCRLVSKQRWLHEYKFTLHVSSSQRNDG